jgi:ssRNA-specific RNase YbeY (16S rRNA maturation enzyme)
MTIINKLKNWYLDYQMRCEIKEIKQKYGFASTYMNDFSELMSLMLAQDEEIETIKKKYNDKKIKTTVL